MLPQMRFDRRGVSFTLRVAIARTYASRANLTGVGS